MKKVSNWNIVDLNRHEKHATTLINSEEIDDKNDKIVLMEDLDKRKEVYGPCGECDKPGTGYRWCQACNAKRFEENFKNWTSGNKDIDELIQHSQLNAVYYKKCLKWIPFKNFQKVTHIAKGGFGEIYSAIWPEGCIRSWNIEDQNWERPENQQVALKKFNYSSAGITNRDFLNEIKSHLQIYLYDIVACHGITKDPSTKDYMMVLQYCKNGSLREYYLNQFEKYKSKIYRLSRIANGLSDIHKAGKVHKDFHSGNILFDKGMSVYISDLGMCQPVNNEERSAEIYGVLPYVAPEVLRRHQYTKAADIYSFGIIMNEYLSEEIPFSNIPHDHILAMRICKGLRPKISEDTPKLLADLIIKCWDAKAEERPTAKELLQTFKEWFVRDDEINRDSNIYSQIIECEKTKENKLKIKPKNIQQHSQAIYTSRSLNFENLLNQFDSECLDCEIRD